MTTILTSIVWANVQQPVNQPWACTDVVEEPYWPACPTKHFHCGIDVGAPDCLGKPLYIARSGFVVELYPGIFGVRVSNGETDYYLHGVYSVLFGAAVTRGQQFGVFGNIAPSGGFTTGPHLHFERQKPGGTLNNPGTSLDPVPILTGRTTMVIALATDRTPYLLSPGPGVPDPAAGLYKSQLDQNTLNILVACGVTVTDIGVALDSIPVLPKPAAAAVLKVALNSTGTLTGTATPE